AGAGPCLGQLPMRNYINANEEAILNGTHQFPDDPTDCARLGGTTYSGVRWNTSGILNPLARHRFAMQTCGGCHGHETGTIGPNAFIHIRPRAIGAESSLSGFLTGITVPGIQLYLPEPVTFDELGRRAAVIEALLEPAPEG